MKPRVSVIILTYNQASTISRAIESVVSAIHLIPTEIVIGDDGSTDSTRRVCQEWQTRYPDMIHLMPPAPNKGLVRNYYDCLRACRGEFITDCAGDDHWTSPRKLDLLTDLLDSNPGANVAFSDWEIIDTATGTRTLASDHPDVLRPDGRLYDGASLLPRLIARTGPLPYNLTAALYRRKDAIEALDSNPDIVCNPGFGCEDLPLMAALAARGGAVGSPGPTLSYHITPTSITGTRHPEKLLAFHLRALRCTLALARHYGVEMEAMCAPFMTRAAYIASLASATGSLSLQREAHEALAEWPFRPGIKARLRLLPAALAGYFSQLSVRKGMRGR